jgi:cysteinyl-tRNA synthetase
MSLRLTNTLGGAARGVPPLEPGRVRMYSCGPTVYGPAHIGNFRSFLFADLLRRFLGWSGYEVTWVMNITDVDDRIIRDLAEHGGTLEELTAPHIERFLRRPGHAARHSPRRDAARHPARARDGGADRAADRARPRLPHRRRLGLLPHLVWPAYGRLARLDPAQMHQGARVASDDYGKDDVRDFALWKGPREGEPSGRPRSGRDARAGTSSARR